MAIFEVAITSMDAESCMTEKSQKLRNQPVLPFSIAYNMSLNPAGYNNTNE